jgi:hypothetical protein
MSEGVFALLGVIVGALGTYLIETRLTLRAEAVAARLELPSIRTRIWDAEIGIIPLQEQVNRVLARVTLLGVDQRLVEDVREAAVACWTEGRGMYEADPDEYGISKERLGRLDEALRTLDEAIVRASRGIRWR